MCHLLLPYSLCFSGSLGFVVQVQEELEGLAYLATTNAMYIVKGEKHVFTNNGSYMTLLDKMKAHVIDKPENKPVVPQHLQSMMDQAMPSSSNSEDDSVLRVAKLQQLTLSCCAMLACMTTTQHHNASLGLSKCSKRSLHLKCAQTQQTHSAGSTANTVVAVCSNAFQRLSSLCLYNLCLSKPFIASAFQSLSKPLPFRAFQS